MTASPTAAALALHPPPEFIVHEIADVPWIVGGGVPFPFHSFSQGSFELGVKNIGHFVVGYPRSTVVNGDSVWCFAEQVNFGCRPVGNGVEAPTSEPTVEQFGNDLRVVAAIFSVKVSRCEIEKECVRTAVVEFSPFP